MTEKELIKIEEQKHMKMLRDMYMGQKAFDFWRKCPLLDGIEADSWEETMVILLMENQRVIHECSLL